MLYDIHTSNKSFLKMSATLRKKGVKNNKFFLILYDDSLVGVDPFSPNLTPKQKVAIYKEICKNKWYYLREVIRIPIEGKLEGIHYLLNMGNLTYSYLKNKNKNIIEILPRQQGKTMGVIADDTWNLLFAAINTSVIYINKQFPDAKKNLKIFKDIRERLPEWLQDMVQNKRADKDNEEYKLVSRRNNSIYAKPSATTDELADKLGRGMSTASIWFDEFAFLSRNKIIYDACYPAWSQSSINAKENGTPYGITITTTPNDLNLPQASFCYSMIGNSAKWDLSCFDMTDAELDEFIDKNSSNDFVYIVYTYQELGRSEEWFIKQSRGLNNDLAKIKRELLLDWPLSNENSVFSETQLDTIKNNLKPVLYTMNVNGYLFKWYKPVNLRRNYILGVDVAGGLSRDSSAIVFVDPEDFSVVANFKNNKIDTDNLRKLIETLMTEYFPNAFLVCEKNSIGLNILQNLMKKPAIEPRILQEPRERLAEKTTKDGFVVRSKTKNIIYGVDTTVQSRKVMFELLPIIVDEEYDKINSEDLYNDIAGLERKKNGKIEHADNMHDDTLMAYLIVRYSLYYGSYLKNHGISAIPRPENVKNGMSNEDFVKMQNIINNANSMIDDYQNPMLDAIYDQTRKINESDRSRTETNLDKFLDITIG